MRLRAKRATTIYLKKSETRFERKMRGFAEYKLASNWKSGSDDGDFQKGRKIMHALLRQASIPMRQVQKQATTSSGFLQ